MDSIGPAPCDGAPSAGGRAPRRYPLLPPGTGLGWTPYAWLIYLGSFLWWPMTGDARPWEIAASFALAAVFIPFYFWGYWQSGRRIVWPALGMAVLGTVGALWTPLAGMFFIYGAGYVSAARSARLGLAVIGGLLAWLAAVSVVLDPHASFWLIGGVFTLLIGGINLHFGQMAQKNSKLRRSQEEVEHLAQVAERERIGRDLHDLLGHTLSLITLKSELAGKLFDRDPEAARREVGEIERISRRALVEVREAVSGYRASGLAAEVERAAGSLRSAGVECERRIDGEALEAARRDPKVEGALAFVVREAVTNVIRHAGATRCEIRLRIAAEGRDGDAGTGERIDKGRERDGGWRHGVDGVSGTGGRGPREQRDIASDEVLGLVITDDGRGGGAGDGFGLTGMRERVTALGGRLHRSEDGGTRITVSLPRPPAASDDVSPDASGADTGAEGPRNQTFAARTATDPSGPPAESVAGRSSRSPDTEPADEPSPAAMSAATGISRP